MSYGSEFVFTLFTNEPGLAAAAEAAGVDRIGLDLESLGKAQRQDQGKAWVSDHRLEDLPAVRSALSSAELFCRTNPIHPGSRVEIDALIDMGVDVLMLPMFRTVAEAAEFIELVDGRATVSLLVETAAAAMRLQDILTLPGIGEIHVGMNDMHIDMRLANHFEVLTSGLVELLAERVHAAGIPFGFAGVGRPGDNGLPVPADLIYAQYPRLGATRALIARSFYAPDYRQLDLAAQVKRARDELDRWAAVDEKEHAAVLDELRRRVRAWTP